MGKGRKANPVSDNAGRWFPHKTVDGLDTRMPDRIGGTSTGAMLATPFSVPPPPKPPTPPPRFKQRWDNHNNFKESNKFTDHDNRNHHQNFGEYFGDGHQTRVLGRRVQPYDHKAHRTDTNYMQLVSQVPVQEDFNTTYRTTFAGLPTAEPPTKRRFPKIYTEPTRGRRGPSTVTTSWAEPQDPPHVTPLQLLAVTQEPHDKHNPWKYSYRGLARVYPDHKIRQPPPMDTMFCRYGHGLKSIS